jgi:hypothetical protein
MRDGFPPAKLRLRTCPARTAAAQDAQTEPPFTRGPLLWRSRLEGFNDPEEVAMSAPLIGMSFPSFVILLILSAFAAAVVHSAIRYRLFNGIDGFIGQWMVAWLGAWLGPAVLGHWFGSVMLGHIYLIPALIGAFAGAFAGTINAKVLAAMGSERGATSSTRSA